MYVFLLPCFNSCFLFHYLYFVPLFTLKNSSLRLWLNVTLTFCLNIVMVSFLICWWMVYGWFDAELDLYYMEWCVWLIFKCYICRAVRLPIKNDIWYWKFIWLFIRLFWFSFMKLVSVQSFFTLILWLLGTNSMISRILEMSK